MPKLDSLSPKQTNAIDYYLDPSSPTYLNKTSSVRKAYPNFSYPIANSNSSKIISKKNMVKYDSIKGISNSLASKITKEKILEGILRIANGKSALGRPVKDHTELKALELLGSLQEQSLFKQTTEIQSPNEPKNQKDIDEEYRELIQSRKEQDSSEP